MLAVLKYGGNAMPTERDPVIAEVAALHARGWQIVIVHGGGPAIDQALGVYGIATERQDGLRITDAATLGVTEATLCGTVNKRLVRACSAAGLPAVGLSGQDADMLVAARAQTRDGVDLGYVGEIVAIDTALLRMLLEGGYVPVVAPLAIASDASTAYNVNADTAAAALAAALKADVYAIISNVEHVLRDPGDPLSAIHTMSLHEAEEFCASDACAAGMKPKMESVVYAVRNGVADAVICASLRASGTRVHSSLDENAGLPAGPLLREGACVSMR